MAMQKDNLSGEFVIAAEKGNANKVMELFEIYGKCPVAQYQALYIAAYRGHQDVVLFLLSKKVDPNFCSENHLPPLHAAAQKGNDKIVSLLLKHGAKVNPKLQINSEKKLAEVDYFSSPLLVAIRNRHEDVAKLLLKNGADINVKLRSPPVKISAVSNNFEKRLTFGDYCDHIELSSDSLFGKLGYSPLHFAVDACNENLVNLLLKHGVDVNSKSKNSVTPLAIAVADNKESIIQILLKAGADTKVQVNGSPLLHHILYQQFHHGLGDYDEYNKKKDFEKKSSFIFLLKLGADPNGWSEKENESILHFAAGYGEVHAVHLLLKYGADLNTLDGKGKTAFYYAVKHLKDVLKEIQDQYYCVEDSSDSDDYGNNSFDNSSEEEVYEEERDQRQKERDAERKKKFEKRKIYNLSHKKYVYNMYQYRYNCDHNEGFGVFQDPEPFRIISQRLTRELVKLEETGKTVAKQNADLLKSAFVKPYYTRCKGEVNKMKKMKLNDGVTLFDILIANESKLKEYENKNILRTARNEDYQKLFPNYAISLKSCLKRGLKRNHPGDDESGGSSDEEEPKASVQMKGRSRKRGRCNRGDDCVIC